MFRVSLVYIYKQEGKVQAFLMNANTLKKLHILAESAKYDVSCVSSGTSRRNTPGGIGSAAAAGVCHSFAADGRCISLLKVLFSNVCAYDCVYCVNRRGNDLPRASFAPSELAQLVIEFYRRNYIEGLFLSSAVLNSADDTMERMLAAVRELRLRHRFNGYIHLKAIPGASPELVRQAGLLADRLSVNIEIPSERNLKMLAPEKDYRSVYAPMREISDGIARYQDEASRFGSAPPFAPAGQSTQLIVGASNENDREILALSSLLYRGPQLRRVFYSAFVPVNARDDRLPALRRPPLLREHRLYQADWLMRQYHFEAEELLDDARPHLEEDIDPKLAWALRHPHLFPLDPNRASYRELLRVPGIGLVSARRILAARRHRRLQSAELAGLGAAMKRARYFLTPDPRAPKQTVQELGPAAVRGALGERKAQTGAYQLSLFE